MTGPIWKQALREVETAIGRVVWPEGADDFTIHPQSGKKRDEGNGVKPIHQGFLAALALDGWRVASNQLKLDAVKTYPNGYVGLEWETGNISSSHRSMNRLRLAQTGGDCLGGILILPTRSLAKYLTDRIGNFEELEQYLPLYDLPDLALAIYAVEHDHEDFAAPRIKKGTDGRSLI
ncbi:MULTISPECIES: hypothetical protein [Mycobacterium]|uniref:hypothetical protein n=1 Tax=Mycobacterium TaxID=1763 RepID=UPI0012FD5386|nr:MULTISPECIES: hypothetical protein [Mycobacterium]UQB94377.1 hypothetical protein KN252_10920 [Mycobacterium intracellulare]WSE44900.1 hypothetical protein QGN30_17180 [Mycobacterium sp. 3-98]